MKNFRVCNNDSKNWMERKFRFACDVVYFIKKSNFQNFTIEWESPLYQGEYITLIDKSNNKLIFDQNFIIPKIFFELINL